MSILATCVNVLDMSKRKSASKPDTDQINFRFPIPLLERMERFKEAHPFRPTLTKIAVMAITEWLDRNEPHLTKGK